jgi:hypothetical protein
MTEVVIAGGGFGGVGAALGAVKAGAEVTLLERTDMLLGTGLVGGIFRNNGRFTATEEAIAMGAGEIFHIMDRIARHRNVEFPRHKHASLYDIYKIEPEIRKFLKKIGVEIRFEFRASKIKMESKKIRSVIADSGEEIGGDVFIDATGTSATPKNCTNYGNGCAYCVLRCYTFKPRRSITEMAGVKEYNRMRENGTPGVLSGACDLAKESLSEELRRELDEKGVVVIPIPKDMMDENKLKIKACVQYAHPEFIENIVLLDTGSAKLMSAYLPLDLLREIPGFENARYEDPLGGGKGNSVRFVGMAVRDNTLKAMGVDNLFVAGEKSGPQVGHTEAITTGVLAGYNAVLSAEGKECIELPRDTVIGDFIAFINDEVKRENPIKRGYTYSGGLYFERMVQLGLYSTDTDKIQARIEKLGLRSIFDGK